MHTEQEFRFGQFRLLRSRRLLLEDGRRVRLGSRAFDLLTALVERAGEVVSKEDLIAYAWPSTIVEETSLRFHLSSLRKVLGDGQQGMRFVSNVSGRGYCFVATVQSVLHKATVDVPLIAPSHAHNLPLRLTRMIGRSCLVESITRLLKEHRLITIVGPGGMGKSTLAVALCDEVLSEFEHGAWFVDLSLPSDGDFAARALADALGVMILGGDPMRSLSTFLKDKQILIVLDNCERVVETAATLAEDLVSLGKSIHIIATSREPLGAKGEWVQSLPPLELPEGFEEISAEKAMTSPAVQLFVERAMASQDSFELYDWEAMSVVEICRRLDGMPLAIELAAAHVDVFGASGLHAQMDERVSLRYRGKRTGPARHQTLEALFDWSYDLLVESDRTLLRRLAVFTAAFSLEAASAVAGKESESGSSFAKGLESLASKSLVVVIPTGQEVRYRLLDTTRSFALERLEESKESDLVRRRHADYLCDVLLKAEVDWASCTRAEWLEIYRPYIDDIRAALDWAIHSPDDMAMSTRLTTGACALAHQLSLQVEFQRRTRAAMDRYVAAGNRHALLEWHLSNSLALLHLTSEGPGAEPDRLFSKALEIAHELDSDSYRAEAITGMFVGALYAADAPNALMHADELGKLASRTCNAAIEVAADRIKSEALFLMGRFKDSKRLAERVLRHPLPEITLGTPYPIDRRISMRIFLAKSLWLEGYPDQAMEVAIECQEMSELEHDFAQCLAFSWAVCPVALWSGRFDVASKFIEKFKIQTARFGFAYQQAIALAYSRVVDLANCGANAVSELKETDLVRNPTNAHLADTMSTMGEAFLSDLAISRFESGIAPWCAAEILRAQGERAMKGNRAEDEGIASTFFDRSLHLAREQGALSWELRTAMSIADLRQRQGRAREGSTLLQSVVNRFTEGFETTDLLRAKAALITLAG